MSDNNLRAARRIETKEQYDAALKRLSDLMDELADYERRNAPAPPYPPIEGVPDGEPV